MVDCTEVIAQALYSLGYKRYPGDEDDFQRAVELINQVVNEKFSEQED
jgi:hypothetical protein